MVRHEDGQAASTARIRSAKDAPSGRFAVAAAIILDASVRQVAIAPLLDFARVEVLIREDEALAHAFFAGLVPEPANAVSRPALAEVIPSAIADHASLRLFGHPLAPFQTLGMTERSIVFTHPST